MTTSSAPRLHQLSPRQFVNDLVAQRAFASGDAQALHRPLEVHLQLTSGCNLDCYMCHEHLRPEGTRHGRGLQYLESALYERIERELFPYSSRLHLGVGGEPMLAPNFLELVERAYARNQRIHLTTNGTRIATDRVAEVLARCVETIEISADGATAATYERVRGGASFARLVHNLELLNRHRGHYPDGERARLTLCMVLMKSNVHELPEFVDFAAKHGANGVAAWPVIPVTEEGRDDILDVRSARPFLDAARARAQSLGLALDLPFEPASASSARADSSRSEALRKLHEAERHAAPRSAHEPRAVFCHMPTMALYVFWDGRVYPCANPAAHQGPPLGNLSTQSFEEVWNGRPFRNLRVGLARGDAPSVCRECPILNPTSTSASPSSDLVDWYGQRELEPRTSAESSGTFVETTVASGLAQQVQHHFEELVQYSQRLERSVRDLEHRLDMREHEVAHERSQVSALQIERGHLIRHAAVLEAERGHLLPHAATLESERWQLVRHAATLESERGQLLRHARTLESEREHLVRHGWNLERILGRIHGPAIYRGLARIKDVFVTPKPKPELPYVPPWVADGSRQPRQPLAQLPLDRPDAALEDGGTTTRG